MVPNLFEKMRKSHQHNKKRKSRFLGNSHTDSVKASVLVFSGNYLRSNLFLEAGLNLFVMN